MESICIDVSCGRLHYGGSETNCANQKYLAHRPYKSIDHKHTVSHMTKIW